MYQYPRHARKQRNRQHARAVVLAEIRPANCPQAPDHQPKQKQQIEKQPNIAHLHQGFQVVIVHVEIRKGFAFLNYLVLHGDCAAKTPQTKAHQRVVFFQQPQPGLPAHHAPGPLAGFDIIRGKQISDAVRNRRYGKHRPCRAAAQQDQQPPVKEAGKDNNRDNQPAPCALREGEQDRKAHQPGQADCQNLGPRFFTVICDPCRKRRDQHQQRTADIGAPRDGKDARAHPLFGRGSPRSRDGHGRDILVDAVQRNAGAQHHHCAVENAEITVVLDQPHGNEEPQQVLHLGAQAVDGDRHDRGYRAHQEKAHADKQPQVALDRGDPRTDRGAPHRGMPDQIAHAQQQKTFVPARSQEPDLHHRPEEIVDRQVHRKPDEQQPPQPEEPARRPDEPPAEKAGNRFPNRNAAPVYKAFPDPRAPFFNPFPARGSGTRISRGVRRRQRRAAKRPPQPAVSG